ncbi:hypothetical protein EMIT0P171_10522 [Pseudomonas sp. IT-P171]
MILQCTKPFGNGYFVRRTIKFASSTDIPYTLVKIEWPAWLLLVRATFPRMASGVHDGSGRKYCAAR